MTNAGKLEKLQWILTLANSTKDLFEFLGKTHNQLPQVLKDRISDSLSSKGMKDNALALENYGVGLPDPKPEELQNLPKAMQVALEENKKYLENIILVLAWPIISQESGGKEKEEKEKKEEKGNTPGFISSSPGLKKEKKTGKAKYSGRIRALCSGTDSWQCVYDRMESFGLLDEAPGGPVDRFFVDMGKKLRSSADDASENNATQKKSGASWEKIKSATQSVKSTVTDGTKDFKKGFLSPLSIFKK